MRSCYAAASCERGLIALDAALVRSGNSAGAGGDDESSAPQAELPARDRCPLCGDPARVNGSGGWHTCARNHRLQRCWVCLQLLSLRAGICSTCGGGSCYPAECSAPSGTVLHATSACGACGLCGSQYGGPTVGAF